MSQTVEHFVSQEKIPLLSIAITENERNILQQTYFYEGKQVRTSPEIPEMRIASVSKTITGALVGVLLEKKS